MGARPLRTLIRRSEVAQTQSLGLEPLKSFYNNLPKRNCWSSRFSFAYLGSEMGCQSSKMPSALGQHSKFVLLTGAGWSHNWGGRLAADVWQTLMDHSDVQNNARLRNLLLEQSSFETALAMTQTEPFTPHDRQQFELALLATFVSMDREIARIDHDPWINIYAVQKLLFRFAGLRHQGVDTGYLFTLNQDLFPERHLYNEHVSAAPAPALPGIQPSPGQRVFASDIGPYSESFNMSPVADFGQARLTGQTNVIKLHGSFNWRNDDGSNLWVVGTQKTAQIAALPLLTWYAEIFKQVLTAGNMRLMVVGYGFGDEHRNHRKRHLTSWPADTYLGCCAESQRKNCCRPSWRSHLGRADKHGYTPDDRSLSN